jgi:hypothetical protein
MGDITQTPVPNTTTPEAWIMKDLQARLSKVERNLEFLINSCPEAQRFMRDFREQK